MSINDNIGNPIQPVNRNSDEVIGNNDGMSIGERVRKARKQKGMTQAALAAKVGIKQSTLSELEKGDSRSTAYIASVAAALGVSPLWLEKGVGPERLDAPEQKEEDELEKIVLLVTYYKQSPPDGRELILETARLTAENSATDQAGATGN